jgi:hypothetical protein
MAHIQTQAAKQRYSDAGVLEVEVWADYDERRCDVCGKLHKTKHPINGTMPIPAHPRCRCCILPVVDDDEVKTETTKPIEKIERKRNLEDYQKRKSIETPKNKFNQEIKFEDAITKNSKWDNSINLIKKLANEYDTRLISVKRGAHFGGGIFNPGSGIMELGSSEPWVAIHEFGHSIATEWGTKVGVEDYKDFWKDLKKFRNKYRKETDGLVDSHISFYEVGNNDDEFVAEAFTLAKMREMGLELPEDRYGKNAGEYADEVLKLIDKYFKKKRK